MELDWFEVTKKTKKGGGPPLSHSRPALVVFKYVGVIHKWKIGASSTTMQVVMSSVIMKNELSQNKIYIHIFTLHLKLH